MNRKQTIQERTLTLTHSYNTICKEINWGLKEFLPSDCPLHPSCVVLRFMFVKRPNEAEPGMSLLVCLTSHYSLHNELQ